jgi:hypothetical protein
MDTLQKLLENTLQKAFSTENIVASILNKKLKEIGIVINDKQLQQLQKEIKNSKNLAAFNFKIDEEEALACPSSLKGQANESFSLNIDTEKDLANIADKIGDIIEKLIPEIASETAETVLETLRQNFRAHQKYYRKQLSTFNKNVEKTWGKAIGLLEMLYHLAVEAGDTFNQRFRSTMVKDNNFVFDVLTKLHARSCQITAEIMLLLSNGFADGAHARWRTLHEIAVSTYFIAKHGNDLAERYLCHAAVESYKASLKYQEYCDALGYLKLTPEEMAEIKDKYQYTTVPTLI